MKQSSQHIREQLTGHFPEREIPQIINRILCHVCHLQNYQILSYKDKQLSTDERRDAEDIVSRLLKNEPIQYILGRTEFFGLPMTVDPRVLIPRPETEELVEWVIENEEARAKGGKYGELNILDACTGSGCIAVSLAKYLQGADVSGLDVSKGALAVAAENARQNQVNIHWILGDLLKEDTIKKIPDELDVIVSNPPYVTLQEKTGMEKNVLDYEPSLALFVPGNRPLIFYDRLADIGITKLKKGGHLFVEINAAFGKETCRRLQEKGYHTIELKQDISGKDRMIKAIL